MTAEGPNKRGSENKRAAGKLLNREERAVCKQVAGGEAPWSQRAQALLAVDEGAIITEVASGSPAAKAGLETGDIIVKFDDIEITTIEELRQAIHNSRIGQEVEITYWRGQSQRATTAELVESPPTG